MISMDMLRDMGIRNVSSKNAVNPINAAELFYNFTIFADAPRVFISEVKNVLSTFIFWPMAIV